VDRALSASGGAIIATIAIMAFSILGLWAEF
jgi:hypothetical protein